MQPLKLFLFEVIWGALFFTSLMELLVLCFAGHGMTVDGHTVIDHWGRRLMAILQDNSTEKNCSEPGMLHGHNVEELQSQKHPWVLPLHMT